VIPYLLQSHVHVGVRLLQNSCEFHGILQLDEQARADQTGEQQCQGLVQGGAALCEEGVGL
jgi:hypothetical protein